MLATLERIELLDQADQLSKMVLESEIVEHYQICLYKMQTNKETQRKINRFVNLKELYEEVQRFGKYHPDYKRVMSQIRDYKREMDLDPLVAEFKLAENDLQALLDEISLLIGGAVSKHIKVPTGNPFFDSGHGSGCGGGGSCGCG
ncbi:YlbF family regulator [Neobacillus drentensis]|uniref:YlbF family regulator n=1 Tax=Neobacillus drentensis TaxID=220684 RepID=UPI0030025B45